MRDWHSNCTRSLSSWNLYADLLWSQQVKHCGYSSQECFRYVIMQQGGMTHLWKSFAISRTQISCPIPIMAQNTNFIMELTVLDKICCIVSVGTSLQTAFRMGNVRNRSFVRPRSTSTSFDRSLHTHSRDLYKAKTKKRIRVVLERVCHAFAFSSYH